MTASLYNILVKIARIVKSRLRDKNEYENKDYFKERVSICNDCPESSHNVNNLKTIDKVYNIINAGDEFCIKCKCPVKLKASEEYESCPINKWKEIEDDTN